MDREQKTREGCEPTKPPVAVLFNALAICSILAMASHLLCTGSSILGVAIDDSLIEEAFLLARWALSILALACGLGGLMAAAPKVTKLIASLHHKRKAGVLQHQRRDRMSPSNQTASRRGKSQGIDETTTVNSVPAQTTAGTERSDEGVQNRVRPRCGIIRRLCSYVLNLIP